MDRILVPIRAVAEGSPRAPLTAGEVAALVAKLNALDTPERARLRIEAFVDPDTTEEEIEELLTSPAADTLGISTATARGGAGGRGGAGPSGAGLSETERRSGRADAVRDYQDADPKHAGPEAADQMAWVKAEVGVAGRAPGRRTRRSGRPCP